MSTPFADAAVDYARRGWRVFKIPPGQKIPKDRWLNGDSTTERATSVVECIAERAAAYPRFNIGIATGNGLAVLDVDPQHGGQVPSWAPPTLTARTPSGGAHLYYAVDGHVRNSQGRLGPGIDVRGDGGMVVAPPSLLMMVGGQWGRYEWVDPDHPVAKLAPSALNPSDAPGGKPILTRECFTEGERHAAMLTLAGTMRNKGCERPEIAAALQALNISRFRPVLDKHWVEKVATSIMQYEPGEDLLP